jgi:glyoxylase-like metal-dependent hydrolase (beta-lactamase superfamily II)
MTEAQVTVRVRPFACGWLTCTDAGFLMQGLSGEIRLPIPSYLIEHPNGQLALFDTGLHPDLRRSTERLGSSAGIFRVHYQAGESVGERLAAMGVDPAAVDKVIFSHLHFDHCGGTLELPNARLVVQAEEWAAGHKEKLIAHDVYNPADFDLGHDVEQVDGRHDVFNDGSVVTVPTPGHTAGHQSLQLRTAEGDLVLCGDACYFRQALESLTTPGFGFDLERQRGSMKLLAELERAGARLWFGHDVDQWETLPVVA